jgi:hypothetical protein
MLLARCIDLINQKASCFLHIFCIAQMRSQNSCSKDPITYSVADVIATKDLELVLGEVRDLLVVDTSLCVTECDNPGNLILDGW